MLLLGGMDYRIAVSEGYASTLSFVFILYIITKKYRKTKNIGQLYCARGQYGVHDMATP